MLCVDPFYCVVFSLTWTPYLHSLCGIASVRDMLRWGTDNNFPIYLYPPTELLMEISWRSHPFNIYVSFVVGVHGNKAQNEAERAVHAYGMNVWTP